MGISGTIGGKVEELIISLVANAPATAVLIYLLYLINQWGKQLLEAVSEIKGMLEQQTSAEGKLSETAPAKLPDPWRGDSR